MTAFASLAATRVEALAEPRPRSVIYVVEAARQLPRPTTKLQREASLRLALTYCSTSA